MEDQDAALIMYIYIYVDMEDEDVMHVCIVIPSIQIRKALLGCKPEGPVCSLLQNSTHSSVSD